MRVISVIADFHPSLHLTSDALLLKEKNEGREKRTEQKLLSNCIKGVSWGGTHAPPIMQTREELQSLNSRLLTCGWWRVFYCSTWQWNDLCTDSFNMMHWLTARLDVTVCTQNTLCDNMVLSVVHDCCCVCGQQKFMWCLLFCCCHLLLL